MPRPVYILGCESLSQDKRTNRLSVFEILEALNVGVAKEDLDKIEDQEFVRGPDQPRRPWGHVVVVWMGLEGDFGKEFEHTLVVQLPDGEEATVLEEPMPITFLPEKPLNRTVFAFEHPLLAKRSGLIDLVARIKQRDGDWIAEQRFPLIVRVTVVEPDSPSARPS